MNASALPAAHAATAAPAAAPPPSLSTLAGQVGNVPLTRVSLAYIEPQFKLYLRFGEPARTLGNRLAARLPLPEYTAERHAAWLAGRTFS